MPVQTSLRVAPQQAVIAVRALSACCGAALTYVCRAQYCLTVPTERLACRFESMVPLQVTAPATAEH